MALLNRFDGVMQVVGGVCAAVVLGAFAWHWCKDWSSENDRKALAQERQAVGTEASLTANLLVAAYKACRPLGLDVRACVSHTGPLIQDQAAPAVASLAVERQGAYEAACRRHYEVQYCNDLLTRAIGIEWQTSRNR